MDTADGGTSGCSNAILKAQLRRLWAVIPGVSSFCRPLDDGTATAREGRFRESKMFAHNDDVRQHLTAPASVHLKEVIIRTQAHLEDLVQTCATLEP